jgi:hypothetical protein
MIRVRHTGKKDGCPFAFCNASVDWVTLGYEAPAETDEVTKNLNLALTWRRRGSRASRHGFHA